MYNRRKQTSQYWICLYTLNHFICHEYVTILRICDILPALHMRYEDCICVLQFSDVFYPTVFNFLLVENPLCNNCHMK